MNFQKESWFSKTIHLVLVFLLVVSPVQAQVFPSSNINSQVPSSIIQPLMLKGMMINTQDPMAFNFIVTGAGEDLQKETTRLAKYFLTSVAISDEDLWVNLSPSEPDRIIPSVLGQTEMGKILLEQDAVLKQLTSELMNPESETGKRLWEKVYEKESVIRGQESGFADSRRLTPDVLNFFNKVWIVPGESVIVQDGERAFIKSSRLNVMLEEEYKSREQAAAKQALDFSSETSTSDIKDLIKSIIVPVIEQEVNEGARFAPLRQVFHSHLLAVWYKNYLRESLLNRVYADQQKISGIEIDPSFKNQVYQQYLQKFNNGAFDVIKEDYDPATQQMVARKYFSGGVQLLKGTGFHVQGGDVLKAMLAEADGAMVVPFDMQEQGANKAMLALDETKSYIGRAKNGTQVLVGFKKDLNDYVAKAFLNNLLENFDKKFPSVWELATGSTPEGIYAIVKERLLELLKDNPDLLKTLQTFNMDEYLVRSKEFQAFQGDWAQHKSSYAYYMNKHLFGGLREFLGKNQTHLFDGTADDSESEVQKYEQMIDEKLAEAKNLGAKTLGIGGVGVEGHVAFNEAVVRVINELLNQGDVKMLQNIEDNNYFLIDDENSSFANIQKIILKVANIRKDRRESRLYKDRLIEEVNKKRTNTIDENDMPLKPFLANQFNGLVETLQKQRMTFYVKDLDANLDLKNQLIQYASTLGLGFSIDLLDEDMIVNSPSRVVELAFSTIVENSPFFDQVQDITGKSYTMGIGTLLKWDEIMIGAYGAKKNPIMKRTLNEVPSVEVPLSMLLAKHPNAVVFMDHAAAEGIEFEGNPQEMDLKEMNMQKMQAEFAKNNAMLAGVYLPKDGKPKGMIWMKKGQKAVEGLNMLELPRNLKIIVIQNREGDAKKYLPGWFEEIQETEYRNQINVVSLENFRQNRGQALSDLFDFDADLIIAPHRDSFVDSLIQVLTVASSHGQMMYEKFTTLEKIFDVKNEEFRMTADNRDQLPNRPNAVVSGDQKDAEMAQELVAKFVTQNFRTKYPIVVQYLSKFSLFVSRYLNLDDGVKDSPAVNVSVLTRMDPKTGEWIYSKKPRKILFGDQRNASIQDVSLNKKSLAVFWPPHSDDTEIAAFLKYIRCLQNGIKVHQILQDRSGKNAVSDADPIFRQAVLDQNIDVNDEKVVENLKNELRFKEMTDGADYLVETLGVDQNLVELEYLDLQYGERSGLTEDQKIAVIADRIKVLIDEQYKSNASQKIPVFYNSIPHPNDNHPAHNKYTERLLRAMEVVRQDKNFNLFSKVENIEIDSYFSPWAGDGQTHFHYEPSETQVQLIDDVSKEDMTPQDLEAAIILMQQKLFAMASGEMSAGFGATSPDPVSLGGSSATRMQRGGFAVDVMENDAVVRIEKARSLWYLLGIRENSSRKLDFELLRELTRLGFQTLEKDYELTVLDVGPTSSDVAFWQDSRLNINLKAVDTNLDKLNLIKDSGVELQQVQSLSQLPYENGVFKNIFDFTQGLTNLPLNQQEKFIAEQHRIMSVGGYGVYSVLSATPKLKGWQEGLDFKDGLGSKDYYFFNAEEIAERMALEGFQLLVSDGLVDRLNQLNDGNTYHLIDAEYGQLIQRLGSSKPIYIVFVQKISGEGVTSQLGKAFSNMKNQPSFADAASLNAPGGIDLGYGKNIKMQKSTVANDIQDSSVIIRMRQNLKGIVPVSVGSVVPLREFLSVKN